MYYVIRLAAFDMGPLAQYVLEPPVLELNGQVMLPLRVLAEAMGGSAEWDGVNRIAIINFPIYDAYS